MGRFFARLMKKANRVGSTMDKYHEAITFAEAGEREPAQRLRQAEVAQDKSGKLLVVGPLSAGVGMSFDSQMDVRMFQSQTVVAPRGGPALMSDGAPTPRIIISNTPSSSRS